MDKADQQQAPQPVVRIPGGYERLPTVTEAQEMLANRPDLDSVVCMKGRLHRDGRLEE